MMEVITVASVSSSLSGTLSPMLAVRLACGSESMSKTLFPALASPIPKFTVVVVFDTPPFWFARAITLHFLPVLSIYSALLPYFLSHTDTQPFHGDTLIPHKIIIFPAMPCLRLHPAGGFTGITLQQGFNQAPAPVTIPFPHPVSPGSIFV